MRRYALPVGITAVVVVFLIVLVVGLSNSGPSNEVVSQVLAGHTPKAPDAQLDLPMIGVNDRQNISHYRGHYLMVNFFAGWCTDCQTEVGNVALARKMLAARGGKVIGVSWDDSSSDALAFLHRNKLTYPAVSDANSTLSNAFGVNGVPESFIISPEGNVVAARPCPLTSGWVITTLDRVLAEHKSAVGAQNADCQSDPSQTS
jgi:cytochrome c biogenesis protein CcmG, thiol:disulfide interchange protein DsbE